MPACFVHRIAEMPLIDPPPLSLSTLIADWPSNRTVREEMHPHPPPPPRLLLRSGVATAGAQLANRMCKALIRKDSDDDICQRFASASQFQKVSGVCRRHLYL